MRPLRVLLEPLELGVGLAQQVRAARPTDGLRAGATSSCVGTSRLFSARYISIDCAIGTRVSASPTKNSVGVFTFATSLIGELFQNRSNGAFFCHGVPPNHVPAERVLSVCA